jgi:RHS repeat-associated protein
LVLPGESNFVGARTAAPVDAATAAAVKATLAKRAAKPKQGDAKVKSFKPEGTKEVPASPLSVTPVGLEAVLSAEVGGGKVVLTDADDPDGAVQLQTGAGTVGLRPVGSFGKKTKPVKDKSGAARWAGVMADGSDLVEAAVGNGVKGEIVLTKLPAGSPVWDFELSLSEGLQPAMGDGEAVPAEFRPVGVPIRIRDSKNDLVAELPAGVAVDANGVESPLDQMLRQAKNGRWIVQVAVDAAWLATAAFPVRVDPTITLPVTSGTLTNVGDTGTWAAGFPMMISDQYWGYGTRNAFVKFPVSGLAGVSNATLNVDIGNCDAPYAWSPYAFPVYISSTTSGWNPASVVYGGVSAGPEQGAYPAYGTRLSFNVTNDVQWWAAGNGAGASGSQGFKIRMDRYAWAGQPNYCNLNNVTLDVNYNPPPVNQPATGAMGLADGATGVAPNAPLGIMNGYDPEGGQVYYYMDLCAPSFATCTTNLWNGGWTTNPNWTTPTLPYLQQAQWRAWVWDGITPSATYIGVRTFTTMPRPNGAPTVVQVSPGSQTTGVGTYSGGTSTVTLTASASDPNGDPVEYLFYIYSYPSWTYLTNSPWQSSSTFSFPLQPGTDYAWYVYVHDLPPANAQPQQQAGAQAWWYMQTVKRANTGPSIPVLQSIANGSVNQSNKPVLNAQSTDADGDTIQYQYTVCPAAGGCVTSPWVAGAWTVDPGLSYNTAYTWSAKARDVPPGTAQAGITTGQSGSWSFTVGANQTNAITAPMALAPADGANTTTRPLLEINATDGDGDGVEYAFEICSPDFQSVVPTAQCFRSPWVATRYWQPPVDLTWGAQYRWRAYARNTSDVLNTVGLAGGWTRTLTPGTPSLNSGAQLAGGYAPNVDIDGGADGAVNEGLGTFVTSTQDAKVASAGPSLSIDRTYNANYRKKGYFGPGWSSNLEIRLSTVTGSNVYLQNTWGQGDTTLNPPVAVTFADGGKEYFSQDATLATTNIGYRVSRNGTFADLVKFPVMPNGQVWQGWRYSTPDRTMLWFNTNGYLVKMSDRNGRELTYSYVGYSGAAATQLTDSASGRSLTMTYDSAYRVTSVSTPSIAASGGALVWNYSYTGDLLTQVCPPTSAGVSGCINYDYQNERLIRVRKPKGNVDVEVTYDSTPFTTAASNLLPLGSFEDPGVSGWAASPTPISIVPSGGAPVGSKALALPYGGAGSYSLAHSPGVYVSPNTTYTLSGQVSGPSAGVYPFVWYYDSFGTYVGSDYLKDASGEIVWSTPATGWLGVKGTFRTFENVASVYVGFYWPSPSGTVMVDGAMLEKGNGTMGRVLTRKDGMGNTTTYSYVQNGANTEVLTDDPRLTVGASKSVYNEKYQIVSNTDSANRTTTFTYDANGFRSGVTDPSGRTTTFTNDLRGSVTQKSFSGGGVTKNEYWSYLAGTSFPSEYRDPRSSSPTDNTYKTTYTYDGAGNRTSETDPTAKSVVYAYTAGSEAAPGGGTQPKGMLKTVTDRTNITKTFAYAQTGDQVQIVDPARGTTTIGYDEIGRPTSTGRAASGALPFAAATMGYDVRSRVVRVTSPAVTNVVSGVAHQLQVETGYDSNGNPTTVTTRDLTGGDPQRQVTTTFDNNDRPTQMSAPNGKNLSYTYDEVGNVLIATDPRGLQVSSAYDDRNLVTSRVALNYADTAGGTTRQVTLGANTYDSLGRIVTQADALGRVTETTYTGDGYVRQVTRKNYRQLNNAVRDVVLQYREYDAVGNVTLERSGAAAGTGVRTVTRSFNSRNFVTSQTLDPAGLNRTTSFATDDEGRQLSATTGSFVSSVGYDAAGRPASSTVGGVGTDTVAYDGWGRAVTATNKRGYATDYVLDIADRIITTRSPDVTVWAANGTSSTLRPESSTGFDTFGGVTHSRDERGLVTVAVNDTSGRTTNVTYPADAGITPTESFAYDVNDNVVSSTDRRSQVSTFTYDLFNRRRVVVGPAGVGSPTSTSVFDDASQLTQSVAADGSVVSYSYDDLGRNRTTGQVVRQDANAVYTTTNDYDDLGNVVLSINPAGKSKTATYNPAGQVVTATDEIGVSTQYGYTPNTGWLASVVQANGRRAATTFDAAGRKTAVSVTDPSGAMVFAVDQWTYDANSNPVTHTRPNGAADTFVYDKLDRMVQSNSLLISPAVYGTVDVGYDVAGNQARITDPRNNTTTSTYNNWNLLSSTVEPSTATFPALTDRTWSVGYDAGGLPTSESRPGGVSVSRAFDALGRMTQETGSGGGSVAATRQFTFDVMGRIATANAPANQQSFTYDDRGLLRTSDGQSSAGYSSFTYDSVGRMTGRTDGAGSVSFGYTDRGEMNSYTVSPSGGQASTVSLVWNPFGQVSQINYPAGVTRTLAYDGAGRLNDDQTSKVGQGVIARRQNNYNPDGTPSSLVVTQPGNTAAGSYSYAYDAGSRLTNYAGPGGSSAYTYDNAGNRLTGDGKSFTYDERNRLTSGGGTSYTWSARGNRTGAVGQAAFTFDGLDRQTGVGGATYTYDSLDRVIGRSVSGVTKFFNYAGFETDPTSDGTSSWSRSPSGSVLGQTRAGTSVLVGTERHGDVAWTLNPTTGTIADSTVSDPYGKALSVTGTPGQVGFQGDWTDPLTGLVWMAARWYDTQTGTFTSRDTYPGEVGGSVTLNRYAYGNNNPLRFSDPTGHWGLEEISWVFDQTYQADPNISNGETVAHSGWTGNGNNTFTWGSYSNEVHGNNNATSGYNNEVTGNNNTTIGNFDTVRGDSNVTLGSYDTVNGDLNITVGSSNIVFGDSNWLLQGSDHNVVLGDGNRLVNSDRNIVAGSLNVLSNSDRNIVFEDHTTVLNKSGKTFHGTGAMKDMTFLNAKFKSFGNESLSSAWSLGAEGMETGVCGRLGSCTAAVRNALLQSNSTRSINESKVLAMFYCVARGSECTTQDKVASFNSHLGEIAYLYLGIRSLETPAEVRTPRSTKPGGSVPDPEPVVRPSGAPNRDSPWYVSYVDANGVTRTVGNANGMHAEAIIQQLQPGASMSRPFGWRILDEAIGPEWVPGTVCVSCQVFPSVLFPPGTVGAVGGPWSVKK